jgi:methylmalonyl-CoA mutase cobalamin-binding subunit
MDKPFNPEITAPLSLALKDIVIPKLLQVAGSEQSGLPLAEQQSQLLAKTCLSSPSTDIESCVLNMIGQGLGLETVFLQTIPSAARLFHQWWSQDEIDFVAVTQASYRLQELVYKLSAEFVLSGPQCGGLSDHAALLVNTPQSQHSLGLLILSQYFKRYGWQVLGNATWREADMVIAVQSGSIDLLGLSVSDESQLGYLKKLIATLRKKSLNPDLLVMVGGPLLATHSHLAPWLGADFSCLQADQAQSMAIKKVEQARKQQEKSLVELF